SCQVPALSKSRVFFLNISWFGMNVMYLILSVEVVPSQVYALVGSEKKGQVLGGMVAAGAVVTFFLSPLVGMKSDRLVSQFGKRRPLMLGGTVLLCIALFGMAFSAPDIERWEWLHTCSIDLRLRRCIPYFNLSVLEKQEDNMTSESDESFLLSILMQKEDSRGNIGLYIAFYLCVMACYSIMSVPYNGLIADLTPSFQRGKLYTYRLMNFSKSPLLLFIQKFNVSITKIGIVGTYSLVAVLYFICVFLTVVSCPEPPINVTHKPIGLKTVFLAYWEPLKERDFRWVFLTRFLMQQGVATVTG
ncbi:unnamed protein product, partial [Porites evermanni]